ncbi:MAG: AMMECR1 domain-containing protein, partial [Bryobacteraceae bacterium]
WKTVADRTMASTTSDPRFPPLNAQEGPVTLEISLLTPMKRIGDWRQFRLGQGAVLVYGEQSGLLLPQVAAEMNWSRDQFLEGLSQKAGLPRDGYRNPQARLYVFRAQVFGE